MKVAVITGANRGIGLEYTKHYLSLGYKVYGVCRTLTDELKEVTNKNLIIIDGVDVTNSSDINRAFKMIEEDQIHLLINNAGIFLNETFNDFNIDSMQKQFAVNTLAPLIITHTFAPKLKSGSVVGMMTSRMGSIADNTSGNYYGYRISKAALNAGSKSLCFDLKSKGVALALLHPGYVKTKMTGFNGDITPEQSVAGLVKVLEQVNLENTGGFWHSNGSSIPW